MTFEATVKQEEEEQIEAFAGPLVDQSKYIKTTRNVYRLEKGTEEVKNSAQIAWRFQIDSGEIARRLGLSCSSKEEIQEEGTER